MACQSMRGAALYRSTCSRGTLRAKGSVLRILVSAPPTADELLRENTSGQDVLLRQSTRGQDVLKRSLGLVSSPLHLSRPHSLPLSPHARGFVRAWCQ